MWVAWVCVGPVRSLPPSTGSSEGMFASSRPQWKRFSWYFVLLATCFLTTLTAPLVARGATPEVVHLQCDTLSVNPLRIQYVFEVVNGSPDHGLCEIVFFPIAVPNADSALVESCATTVPAWACAVLPDLSVRWIASTDPPDCVRTGQTRGSFSFVTDKDLACYFVAFGSPIGNFGEQEFCFRCDEPIQATDSTWGRLKALYH